MNSLRISCSCCGHIAFYSVLPPDPVSGKRLMNEGLHASYTMLCESMVVGLELVS